MDDLHLLLDEKIRQIKLMEKRAELDISNGPAGTLRITHSGKGDQYYLKNNSYEGFGKYIKKKDMDLILGLAQRDYAKKVIPVLKSERNRLEKCAKFNGENLIKDVYAGLSEGRRALVQPYILPDDQYEERWLLKQKQIKDDIMKRKELRINEYRGELQTSIFMTENGEQVKSKSEKIIADKFYLLNIVYQYEVPLFLKGYGYVKPDFKILNRRTRKEYYWEHLGMMDDGRYAEKSIKKIQLYERNGISVGDGLILTYETRNCPLNMKNIELMIEKYLI